MSYQTRIEDMIGKHVAEYQQERICASNMPTVQNGPRLPYGYPVGVYHPMHICRMPAIKHFIARTGGRLSNGVPRVLGAEFVDGYPLGVYNHHTC